MTRIAQKALPVFPMAKAVGVTGDNRDPSRMVIVFEGESGETFRLSMAIENVHWLDESVRIHEPSLAKSWAKRRAQT